MTAGRVTAIGAWSGGFLRVRRAPGLLLVLWLASLAVAVPPALMLRDQMASHLHQSLEADLAADGVNFDWLQEFRAQADPLGRSLRPDVIGFAAVIDNTSALADVDPQSAVVAVSAAVFIVLLWFVTPAVIQRLAGNRSLHAGTFLASCGAFAGRMLRLAAVSVLVYGFLLASVHPWLFDQVYDGVTREMTVERNAFFVRLAMYIVFFAVIALVNLLFDFTKIRMVVEDRHSVAGAITAAARFIRANRRLALGVYALNVLTFGGVLAVYGLAAPGAGAAGLDMWVGFLLGQAYLAARLAVKLLFWGSEIVALQARFNAPGFVRGPA